MLPGQRSAAAPAGAGSRVPRTRRTSLGPVPEQRAASFRPALHALVLSAVMRSRLRAAVRALLADPGLAGASDAVRWAAVVLLSRTGVGEAMVEIRTPELGRWCGLSADRARTVVNGLRGRKLRGSVEPVVTTVVKLVAGSTDTAEALVCTLTPVARSLAAAGGPAGRCPETGERDPLVLEQRELSVLHGLVEAVAGPGFLHLDGRVSPPGLLAHRTGHGAAVDRLAVLLMVLDAGARGRVRLCGGRVDTGIGRPAVTLSRMLGCSPLAAARILARLEEGGVVERPRRGASGLGSRSRLLLPAVAAAYQADQADLAGSGDEQAAGERHHAGGARPRGRADAGGPGRKAAGTGRRCGQPGAAGGQVGAVPPAGGPAAADEPVLTSPADLAGLVVVEDFWEGFDLVEPAEEPLVADLEGTVGGQLPAVGTPLVSTPPVFEGEAPKNMQVSSSEEGEKPGIADPAVTTPLHAYHSPVAGVVGELDLVGGFSGACAVVAQDRRPQRTGVREEHTGTAEDGQDPIPAGASIGEVGPLRGEKPKISSTRNVQEQSGSAAGGQRPVPLPPQDLLLALAPVESLWERLDRRWAREKIIDTARLELALVARWTGRQGADQALAERLRHRLRVQGGSALVTDPVGWLLGKGLPRRQECAHGACDDGIRLDTGAECATCEMRITDRRNTRRAVVGQVVAQMPDAAPGELRSAIDEQLHRHAELRAGQQVAERQRTERRRAEAEARNAMREAEAAAAEAARRVLACEDCGAELAGGLCALCQTYRTTRTVMVEAVNLALAGTANLADRTEVGVVIRQVNAALREEMLQSRPAGADLVGIRESDLLTVRSAAAEYRASALELLTRSPQADTEAEQAHAAAMRRAHRHPNRASAVEAADRAADQARHNAADCLLAQRLGAVQAMRERSRQTSTTPIGATVREAVTA